MDNLTYYNRFKDTPKEACKSFNNGQFSGTDINPMYRIKRLTEVFGPAGLGWYYKVVDKWSETFDGEVTTNIIIELFVKDPSTGEWSMPIQGIGGNRSVQQFSTRKKVSDEGWKMALTDALSVACKALGIGADIYYANDPTKYTSSEALSQPNGGNVPPQTYKPVESPTNSQYQPMPANAYWKVVESYAKGVPAKDGRDYRTVWAEATHADQSAIDKFDHDVENYKLANPVK